MNLWQGILLGFVQGVTEFLPVSSDGHLVLVKHLAGVSTPGVFVEIALHVATLGAVLVVYGGRFWRLTLGVLRRDRDALVYTGLLVLATLPAVFVGLFLKHAVERTFDSLWWAGGGFVVTGTALWTTRRLTGARAVPSPGAAVVIGTGQALAILPGVSRSGLTVSAGLWSRLTPVDAAAFSFLMAIPAIMGAAILEVPEAMADIHRVGAVPLVVSCVVAFVTGVWSIRWLVALLARGRFYAFAPYCWAIGAFTLAYALWHG